MSNASVIPHPTNKSETVKPVTDILIVMLVSGLAYLLEGFASAQGLMVVSDNARGASAVLGGAFAAVAVVLSRGGTLVDLGFKRPENWAKVPLQVAAILVAFIAMQTLVPAFLSLIIELPAPDYSKSEQVYGNLGAAIALALILPLTASIPEEIIYRGFLMGRLSDIFGETTKGAVITVLVQAVIFGSIHFAWGIGGQIMTLCMGIVWGTAYLWCGRNLWVVIFAHSAGHILYVTQLYYTAPVLA